VHLVAVQAAIAIPYMPAAFADHSLAMARVRENGKFSHKMQYSARSSAPASYLQPPPPPMHPRLLRVRWADVECFTGGAIDMGHFALVVNENRAMVSIRLPGSLSQAPICSFSGGKTHSGKDKTPVWGLEFGVRLNV